LVPRVNVFLMLNDKIGCNYYRVCEIIETGGYSKPTTPVDDRLCDLCDMRVVENEKHFLLDCPLYSDLRYNVYYECSKNIDNFYTLDNDDKFINMMHCKEMWNRISWHRCYIRKRFKRVFISPYHWRFKYSYWFCHN